MKMRFLFLTVLCVSSLFGLLLLTSGCEHSAVQSELASGDTLGVDISAITHPANNSESTPLMVEGFDGNLLLVDPAIQTVTYEDILAEIPEYPWWLQHAIIEFNNLNWDHDGVPGGWGFGVYNTVNASPMSGTHYTINRHGKNFLGFTFPDRVHFKGAAFARASLRWDIPISDPASHSAHAVRYHFYDLEGNQTGTSDWFEIEEEPMFCRVNVFCARVVVEHDVDNPMDNVNHNISDAEWYMMDDVTYIYKEGIVVNTPNLHN